MSTELQEHQKRVLDKLYAPEARGLVAYHSMGSGKTLTALEALRRAGKDADKLVITPASLVDNVSKESKKHKIPLDARTQVFSYERAANRANELAKKRYGLVVLDEAHRMRNAKGSRASAIRSLIDKSDKRLFLTGTAGYNHPADMMELVKLVDDKAPVFTNRLDFENRYVDEKSWRIKPSRRRELKRLMGKYVDVYDAPRNSEFFPSVKDRTILVPMGKKQEKAYRFVEKDLPPKLRKAVSNNLPLSLKDATSLNMFATGVRQVSTSPVRHDITAVPEDSAKLMSAAGSMLRRSKDPNFRGVAYSNFLDAGLVPYEELLKKKGLSPMVYTGKLNAKEKKELIDKYNAPGKDPRILLLSSAGAEGLDLKGTRLMQVLEPHFNRAKIDQVTARGARYKSHMHLPETERNMEIERYQSVFPQTRAQKFFGMKPKGSIDEYLEESSRKKQRLIDDIKALS